jgi:hypothetical protein
MTTTNTEPSPRADLRKAAVIIGIAVFMCSAFAGAYIVALGRPMPHNVPVGVVGPPAVTTKLVDSLEVAEQGFAVHSYPSREAAITAINRQTVVALIDATARPPQLVLSSASDPSSARVLAQLNQPAPGRSVLPSTDLHPLPPSDPAGLATFYLVIAATILGFVSMFQLRANVKTLTLGRWLVCVLVLAVVGGAALATVVGPVLGALHAPFGELWLLVSLQIATAALFNSTMLVLVHRWAILPTWAMFILLGNTSSGGAVSVSLLPQPFALLNHALPSGAAVSAIHTATYFPEHQRPLPLLVLAGWVVLSAAALIFFSRRLGRSPAQ